MSSSKTCSIDASVEARGEKGDGTRFTRDYRDPARAALVVSRVRRLWFGDYSGGD